jgi:hypothetical protein
MQKSNTALMHQPPHTHTTTPVSNPPTSPTLLSPYPTPRPALLCRTSIGRASSVGFSAPYSTTSRSHSAPSAAPAPAPAVPAVPAGATAAPGGGFRARRPASTTSRISRISPRTSTAAPPDPPPAPAPSPPPLPRAPGRALSAWRAGLGGRGRGNLTSARSPYLPPLRQRTGGGALARDDVL